MPENQSRFVLVCQQTLVLAVVAATGLSAAGVVELDIVGPGDPQALSPTPATSLVAASPTRPRVRSVPLSARQVPRSSLDSQSRSERPAAQQKEIVSAPEQVTGYATVGLTWEQGSTADDHLDVEVRTYADGVWSPWQEMHADADHQPDPGTEVSADGAEVRDGTDAVVVGDVDDVQVRASSSTDDLPRDVRLAIIDPGVTTETDQAPALDTGALATPGTAGATNAPTAVTVAARTGAAARLTSLTAPRPQIFSRAQWGADERLRDPGSLRYGTVRGGFVHHTVNANDYDRAEVPAIIRGIYAYHTRSRGWSDLGYNFLVDRFGQIWEGRYGGVDRPVVGAHTLGYNEESFAMSAIGNFDITAPSSAMLDAYAALFAWKLGLHDIAADDPRVTIAGRTFPAINGHRDAGSTACPGRYLYAELPQIRTRAARLQGTGNNGGGGNGGNGPAPRVDAVLRDAGLAGSPWPDLVVRERGSDRGLVLRTGGQSAFEAGRPGGPSLAGADLVVTPGDVDGDRRVDLLARDRSTGTLRLYPGTDDGRFAEPARSYWRFARFDQITGVGDFDGDGNADLAARVATDGRLLLMPGNGSGGFSASRELSPDWSRYDLTVGAGDLDGDGRPDLVARRGDTLLLVPGSGDGLRAPVALGSGWSGFDLIAGGGDVTGDAVPDLLARERSSGASYLYPGTGTGGLEDRVGGWTRFAGMRTVGVAGRMVAGGMRDAVAVKARGELRVFAHNNRRNLLGVLDTGASLRGADLVLGVGDWDGDGRGDVVTRDGGTLQLRRGQGGGALAAPVTLATGWARVTKVRAVGDVTGDGHPDLTGRTGTGWKVFPGDGRTGLGTARAGRVVTPQVPGGAAPYDWVVRFVDVDGDRRADILVRAEDTGALWWFPGTPTGFADRRLIGGGTSGYDLGG